jgi:hypothetical protein
MFVHRRGAQVFVPAVPVHNAKAVAIGFAHANAHGRAAAHVFHVWPRFLGEESLGAPRTHPPRGQTVQVLAVRLCKFAAGQAQGTLQPTPRTERLCQGALSPTPTSNQTSKGKM